MAARVVHHRTGPEQDQRARLAVVRAMSSTGHSAEEMAEVLDALALLPGQEEKRNLLGVDLRGEGNPTCLPKDKTLTYIPS
jgi:hypothetical protein